MRELGSMIMNDGIELAAAKPLDSRMKLKYYRELTLPTTWVLGDDVLLGSGESYAYVGMVVSVTNDLDISKNGVYRLNALPTETEANWIKLSENIQPATDEEYNDVNSTRVPTVKQVKTDVNSISADVISLNNKLTNGFINLQIPKLSSNGIPYVDDYAVGASSEYSADFAAWKAANQTAANSLDCWSGSASETDHAYYLYFNTQVVLNKIVFHNRQSSTTAVPSTIAVYGNKINVVGNEVWELVSEHANNVTGVNQSWYIDIKNDEQYYSYKLSFDKQVNMAMINPSGIKLALVSEGLSNILIETMTKEKVVTDDKLQLVLNTYGEVTPLGSGYMPYTIVSYDANVDNGFNMVNFIDNTISIAETGYCDNTGTLITVPKQVIELPIDITYIKSEERPQLLTSNGTPYVDDYAVSSPEGTAYRAANGISNPYGGSELESFWAMSRNPTVSNPGLYYMYFKENKLLKKIKFKNRDRNDGVAVCPVKTLVVQASTTDNDVDQTWITLKSHTNSIFSSRGEWEVDLSSVTIAYRNYRIQVTSNGDNNPQLTVVDEIIPVYEVENEVTALKRENYTVLYNNDTKVYDVLTNSKEVVGDRVVISDYDTPILTSYGTPYVDEYAIYTPHTINSTMEAYYVTLKETVTKNESFVVIHKATTASPVYLYFYFNKLYKLKSIDFQNRLGADPSEIKAFTLEGTKDNIHGEETWVTIASYTNDVLDKASRWSVIIPEDVQDFYQGYRIVITDINGTTYTGLGVLDPIGDIMLDPYMQDLYIDRSKRPVSCDYRYYDNSGVLHKEELASYKVPVVCNINNANGEGVVRGSVTNSITNMMSDDDITQLRNRLNISYIDSQPDWLAPRINARAAFLTNAGFTMPYDGYLHGYVSNNQMYAPVIVENGVEISTATTNGQSGEYLSFMPFFKKGTVIRQSISVITNASYHPVNVTAIPCIGAHITE